MGFLSRFVLSWDPEKTGSLNDPKVSKDKVDELTMLIQGSTIRDKILKRTEVDQLHVVIEKRHTGS